MQGRAMVSLMGENDRLACEALARVAEAVPANEYTAYVKYDAYRHVLVASGAHRMMTYYARRSFRTVGGSTSCPMARRR